MDKDFVGDACDPCKFVYDRYQNKSNVNLFSDRIITDINKDGTYDFCDEDGSPDFGLSILTDTGTGIKSDINYWPVSEKDVNNEWTFGYNNWVDAVGDFDGDSRDNFIIRSPEGIRCNISQEGVGLEG